MSSCNGVSVNKTFIIEPLELTGGSPTLSACTTMYTNLVESCSGDTTIQLGTGLIVFNGNGLFPTITATTIEATTYLSGGTNILDIINSNDTFVTGGTFNNFTDSIQLTRNDGVNIIITGLTDFYTTGASLYNNILYFDRNDVLSAYTVDLSSLVLTDTYLTGATYDKDSGILELTRNDNVSIIASGITDYYVTAGTYNTLTESIDFSGNNQVTTFSVDVSALIDDTNTFITGFTYDNSNNLTIVRNDGTAFTTNISVVSGLTINGNLVVTGFTSLQSTTATTAYLTSIETVDYIQFNSNYTGGTTIEGRMYWDEDNGTVSLGMHGGVVSQQIGEELYYYIKNQSGATIENGRVVRAAGTLGASGRILGEYMIADGSIPAKYTLGIATEDIINGDDGYVTEFGLVRGMNTTGIPYGETWNEGDILWVSNTVAGGLTNVHPIAQNGLHIEIAIVIYKHATNGSIFVRPHRYPSFHDLQDAGWSAGTENNLDIIQWNETEGLFELTSTPLFNSISATTISGVTFYGDGSNLTGIDNFYTTASTLVNNILYFDRNDTLSAFTVDLSSLVDDTNYYVTGGTINYNLGEILLNRNDNVTVTITGLTDFYTTGATLINKTLYFDRNDTLSAYTVNLSSFTTDNFYTTGATLYGAVAYFDRNDTLSAYTLDYSSLFNSKFDKSGGTVTGSISAITISANTFYGDGSNLTGIDNFYTTGVTIYNNIAYFDRTDVLSAYTLSLSGFATNDIYVTGGTVSGTNLTLRRNDNVNVLITGFSNDIYTTGSTLIGNIAYFNTTNALSAYTLDLTSLAPSGGTDNYTTGVTVVNNIAYFNRTDVLSAYTLTLTGFATNDIYVTGGTVNGTELTLTRNDNVNVLITGFSTDIHTTGSTLIGNIAYFNTTNALSAYTLDLTSLSPSGGTDIYTTGATVVGNTAYFDRTDTLSAYTLDLSTIAPTGTTSGGTDTIRVNGVRGRNNNSNIFLRFEDSTPYNLSPYRAYQDLIITNVIASCSSVDTWDAHILTGTSIATDSIYFLSLVSQTVNYDDSVNISVSSGTTLYLYMSGTGIDYPAIDVYLRKA